MTDRRRPARKPPKGLEVGGKRLWRAIAGRFDLEQHETELLTQACRTLDLLERLQEAATAGPLQIDGKTNPLLAETRLQRITLARLLAAMRLPDEEQGRPQRRTGARGVYQAARQQPAQHSAGHAATPPAAGNVASLDERRAQLLADDGLA